MRIHNGGGTAARGPGAGDFDGIRAGIGECESRGGGTRGGNGGGEQRSRGPFEIGAGKPREKNQQEEKKARWHEGIRA